jgi:hypothetical protein
MAYDTTIEYNQKRLIENNLYRTVFYHCCLYQPERFLVNHTTWENIVKSCKKYLNPDSCIFDTNSAPVALVFIEESIPENTIVFKDCKAEYMKGV